MTKYELTDGQLETMRKSSAPRERRIYRDIIATRDDARQHPNRERRAALEAEQEYRISKR